MPQHCPLKWINKLWLFPKYGSVTPQEWETGDHQEVQLTRDTSLHGRLRETSTNNKVKCCCWFMTSNSIYVFFCSFRCAVWMNDIKHEVSVFNNHWKQTKLNWQEIKVRTLISQDKQNAWRSGCLFLVLQLIGQPIKALIEAIATGGTRGLDVPVAVTQGMQAQLVRDLGGVHGVW